MSDEFNKADEGTKSQPREIPKAQAMHQAAIMRFEHRYFSFLGEIGEYIREVANAGGFSIQLKFDAKDPKRPVMHIFTKGPINHSSMEIGSLREYVHIFHGLPIFLQSAGYNINIKEVVGQMAVGEIHISWDSYRSSLFKGEIG